MPSEDTEASKPLCVSNPDSSSVCVDKYRDMVWSRASLRPEQKVLSLFIFASKLYFYSKEHCWCVHKGAITFYQLAISSTCRQRYKCCLMLHPHCHGGMPELTSHCEFGSFNVGWFDSRTSKLVAPRRRARILDGTPVEDFAISGPLQRLSCRTPPYVFPGGQLKHPAMFTVRRRGEWASTTVTHR